MAADIRLIVQLSLGLVFLFSCVGKFRDPVGFAQGAVEFKILPQPLAFLFGLFVIPMEGLLATSHLTGWLLGFTAPVGLGMLASFGVAVGVNVRRRRILPCNCFGERGGETISIKTLARLCLLFLGETVVLFNGQAFRATKMIYPEQVQTLQGLALKFFCAVLTLLFGMWMLAASDLLMLARRRSSPREWMRGKVARWLQPLT